MYYNVNVIIMRESRFVVEVEADSEDEAEKIVEVGIWSDDYTDEIRMNSEITDEEYYNTEEICNSCWQPVSYCECTEEKDDED